MQHSDSLLFKNQLPGIIKDYPNLKILNDDKELSFLSGVLDIPNDEKKIVGNFLIEIHSSNLFPYRFPNLFEVGGEIPAEADWHKYKDGRCCITVEPDEILKCNCGISLSVFIEKHVLGYFANHIHRKLTGSYKNGEYSHGPRGIMQFYISLLKTSNKNLWITYFKNVFRGLRVPNGRNNNCFCGSENKYKHCHLPIFNAMNLIGEKQVLDDFRMLMG